MPFFGFTPTWTVALLSIVFVLLILLVLGFSYMLSVIHVYLPDIHPIWGVFTHALFFVSPIFWYLDDVSGIVLEIHKINPMGQLIELGHKLVVSGEIPPLSDWLYSVAFVIFVLFLGFTIFQKYQGKIVENL